MDEDPFLTVDEVAAMLRLHPQTVRNTIDRGELAAVRVRPRRVRIRKSAPDQFIADSAAMMGPSVDDARADFDAALSAVQTAPGDAELPRRSANSNSSSASRCLTARPARSS